MVYPFKKSEAAKLLASDDAYAFVLIAILLPVFGDDLFTEDTSILFADIEDYFDCHLSEESENRINAAITAMTTDLFFTNVNMFNSIALSFAEGDIGDIPDGILETPDVGDMLWAVQEMALLIGEPKESEEFQSKFSPAVVAYINEQLATVAEELDEVPDDVDTLDEAFDVPYFERVIDENTAQLIKQLHIIGVDASKLIGYLEDSNLSN